MKDLISSVINIFKYTGRFFTIIRNTIFNLIMVLVFIMIIFSIIPKKQLHIPSNTILKLDISGDIVEEKKLISSFERLLNESFSFNVSEPETCLQDILDIINQAAKDDRIIALTLNLKNMGRGGINQLQSIGEALKRFKSTGKPVIAIEDYYTQSQYFLASYADKVFIHPMGGVDLHGLGVYRLYFKDGLEKLEINYNVFKVGTYKSALEPITRNSMSDADRQQNELWLSALWQVYTDEIVKERNISLSALHQYTDNIAEALTSTNGNAAQLALDLRLVDQIATRQETASYLATLSPHSTTSPDFLASADYLKSITPSYLNDSTFKSKVGLIIAEGNILPGKQPPGVIGGDSLANLIQEAREDISIKALVLRVNSGGGSAFASEIIRHELLELKKSGKPIVVSMGTVAASGGYWVAADADEIWASPSTITGSIGVFGAIPTFEKTLANLGIYRDGIGTTPLASGLDITQPLPEQLKSVIQQSVIYNYNQFLEIVANGRNLEKSKVAELAEGRIYDGRSAMTLGLVDKLGYLEDAIESAAKLANLQNYCTTYIRPATSVRDQFLQFLTSAFSYFGEKIFFKDQLVQTLQKSVLTDLNKGALVNDPRGVYAQCVHGLVW